ncbi:extracellular solute-binding protein [Streptosporangiaceae bacterium NEAU-GS5]|nr:extracellular solute-binding protein [Streptosporangiaceae bacterium NEAU-GS5]
MSWWSDLTPFRRRLAVAGFAVGVAIPGIVTLATNQAPPGEAACADRGELVVATGSDVSAASYRRDLIQEWNSRPGSLNARLVEISDSTDEERAEMMAAVQAGRCPYDILVLDVAWTPEFAAGGYLQEIAPGSIDHRDFVPKVWAAGQVDGAQFGVPFATDAPLLFYKTGLPVPRDPAEMLKEATAYGYAGQFDDYEGGTVNLMEAVESGGARITDGDSVVLDDAGQAQTVVNAVTAWKNMLDAGAKTPNGRNLREESSLQAFKTKNVGYMRNWPFAFHRLAVDSSMRDESNHLKFGIIPFPGRGIMGGVNLAVLKSSPHLAQALDLIKFLTSHDAQARLFACGGYAPVLESVYEEYRAKPTTCSTLHGTVDVSGEPQLETSPTELQAFAAAIRQSLSRADERPRSPYYAEFSTVFRACLRQAITGEVAPADLDLPGLAAAMRDAADGRRPGTTACRKAFQ